MDTIKSEKTKPVSSVHGSEWVSSTVPPSALITLVTGCVTWAPHSFHLLLPSPWGAHTMTKKDKKSFAHSLADWKLFDDPTTRVLLECAAKGWGFILPFYQVLYGFLAALYTLTMWTVFRTMRFQNIVARFLVQDYSFSKTSVYVGILIQYIRFRVL